ncbi:hypothetical protein [Streptomyces sp. B6B3]|uniref:hypothetical protein n=1 Tax=Streptomyces sp. B6B3 TaxID=3153570 RepID=UPI00325C545A
MTAPAVRRAGVSRTAENDECEGAFLGEWACSTLNDIPGVNWVYGWVGEAQRQKVEAVTDALGDIVPDSFIEEWVKGMAESTVSLLTYIQALGERVTAPAFDQRWWASQYATSFGLSLIVLAFLLVWITAQFVASGSSATATDLFRQSGWRLVFVVPLISAGPLILLHLQVAANDLARVFADEGTAHAESAVERLMDLIVDNAGDWGAFGGTVLALLLFLFILCLGLVTLIEMAVAQWGLHLGALLVPLALVAWVYPPWSGTLRRLTSLIAGLMLLPAFIYFFFNTIWSSFDSLLAADNGDDGLSVLLFLAVGLLMIDAFPMVVMWLMSLTAGPGTGMDPDVRAVAGSPSAGEMTAGVMEHLEARTSQIGAAGGSGGAGAGEDADEDDDAGPAAASPSGPDREQAAQAATIAATGGAGAAASAAQQGSDDDADDSGTGAAGFNPDPARAVPQPGGPPDAAAPPGGGFTPYADPGTQPAPSHPTDDSTPDEEPER